MKAYCEACGATPGTPHHDDAPRKRTTTLHSVKQAVKGRNMTLCMLCRDGVYAIRRDESRKKRDVSCIGNPDCCDECGASLTDRRVGARLHDGDTMKLTIEQLAHQAARGLHNPNSGA